MSERAVEAVRIQGLRDFRRELKRMGPEFPAELKQANLDAAELVAADARRRAPRGPHEGGGRVVPISQNIRALGSQAKGQVAIGGARSPHAVVTEFGGTIPRRGQSRLLIEQQQRSHRSFVRAGLSVTPVRAQPYLYPALAAQREAVIEFYGEAIDRVSRRAFPSRGFL